MNWHEKLVFARKIKNMIQATAARHVKISQGYLIQIEQGKIADPSYFKMTRLLHLYNLDPDDIAESE